MSKQENALLIKQGAKLTALGARMEAARGTLRRLVEKGVPYSDPRMAEAYEHFAALEAEWQALEEEHLALKSSLPLLCRR